MWQAVRITSKRQICIPVSIFNKVGLKKGDRLIVEIEEDKIILQKAQSLLDKIAGSIKLPRKFKDKPLNEIIKLAKKEYFESKK